MKVVYKVTLQDVTVQDVCISKGAEILKVDLQHGKIVVWYLCNPMAEEKEVRFKICITGKYYENISYDTYIGTIQMDGGSSVIHVFME